VSWELAFQQNLDHNSTAWTIALSCSVLSRHMQALHMPMLVSAVHTQMLNAYGISHTSQQKLS
jgi:hypothetical protein